MFKVTSSTSNRFRPAIYLLVIRDLILFLFIVQENNKTELGEIDG